jgi:hypothetical protein
MDPHNAQPLPARPNLENFRKIAKGLVKSGAHPTLAKAQFALARSYGFESWTKFIRHLESLARNSPVSQFEAAVDAVVAGDTAALRALLSASPGLVHARSTRRHAATLLIYTAANGVENYRQKTPPNIVEIVNVLLDAGAGVNATANLYDGACATLELAATSIHPLKAGVQNELLQTLLDRGASIDKPSLLTACLANNRPQAAEFLAARGARIDFAAAAGLGRLEIAKALFDRAKLTEALIWASEYGRNEVVEFLLANGADLAAHRGDGQTALHWAVIGGQVETVKLLLRHNPPLQAENKYGGTPKGQAEWSAANAGNPETYQVILDLLRQAGG